MLRLEIAYNPYRMEITTLKIDDCDIKENASGYERIHDYAMQNIPLQSWIDPIPYANWRGLLREAIGESGESEVSCHFSGREMDFEDLKESFDGEDGVNVTYSFKRTADDKDTKERIINAYQLIRSEKFKEIIEDKLFAQGPESELRKAYDKLPEQYDQAMNAPFRIVFAGMYSSGKSTVINALLGKELLPTSDNTCTSKVFKIKHDPQVAFAKMRCLDKNENVVVEEREHGEESLKAAFKEMFPRGDNNELLDSKPETIDVVEVFTDLSHLLPECLQGNILNLEIIDTPGIDSGMGNRVGHDEITKSVIQSEKKEIVIFCVKAATPEQKDIQEFLNMADESQRPEEYGQRFFFVLNLADERSFKEGETWGQTLRGIKDYYCTRNDKSKRPIGDPRFFPTSARAAFHVRTGRIKEADYKSIREKYYTFDDDEGRYVKIESAPNYYFDQFCSTSQKVKNVIESRISQVKDESTKPAEKIAKEIELHSGIASLEMAIREYIEKYAFPLKLQELLRTYEIIFKETDQLCNYAKSAYEDAKKARENKENKKEDEEKEKKKKEESKIRLDRALTEIAEERVKLSKIREQFSRETERKITDAKSNMHIAINKAKSKVIENPWITSSEIVGLIKSGQTECENTIKSELDKNRNEFKKVENEVNVFFQKIRDLIDLGGFDIKNTTGFKRIEDCTIEEVIKRAKGARVDNRYYSWRGGLLGILDEFFKNIGRSQTRIDNDKFKIDEFVQELEVMAITVDNEVARILSAAERNLADALIRLGENIDKLKFYVADYSKQLDTLKKNIENLSNSILQNHEIEKRFKEYCELLSEIRQIIPY